MTGIEIALAVAGTAMSAIGAISQANSAAAGMEYNAAVSRNAALSATYEAAETERRTRRDGMIRAGAIGAARGASGVALEGSPLDVMEDSAAETELSALDARYEGLVRSNFYNTQAELEMANASRTRSAGMWSAVGSILGQAIPYGRSLMGGKAASGMTRTAYTSGVVNRSTGRMVGGT